MSEGKQKKTRFVEKLIEFQIQYLTESDRAAVILCAAKMDYLLYQALQSFFIPNPSSQDDLLDSDRALGTFSARINAAYRLELIDASLCRALHLFRKIRNEFAHELGPSKMSEGSHKDRFRELVQPLRKRSIFQTALDMKHPKIKEDEVYAFFYMSTSSIIVALELLCEHVRPVKHRTTVSFEKNISFTKDSIELVDDPEEGK